MSALEGTWNLCQDDQESVFTLLAETRCSKQYGRRDGWAQMLTAELLKNFRAANAITVNKDLPTRLIWMGVKRLFGPLSCVF